MSETSKKEVISIPCQWPYRLLGNALILGFIFFLAFIIVIIKTNFVGNKFLMLQKTFFEYTESIGFILEDVTIQGRGRTTTEEINNIISLKKGDSILDIDIYKIKSDLETLPWVKKATIRRSFFPNNIHIALTEKKVSAIWQISEKFHPLDEDGKVINAPFKAVKPILLIVGQGAPENITKLLDIIKEDEKLYSRIKVANFISNRRWDLVLDDIKKGLTIKLPEENYDIAWKKLIKLEQTDGLLKRKLTIIDLRLKDKVIVKIEKDSAIKNSKENDI